MSATPNVRGLSRRASTGQGAAAIPMPTRRWRTRILLPAAILTAVLGLVAYSVWDRIVPAVSVRTAPVVVKVVSGTSPGSVTVQAPGWLEPDPHPVYVSALTGGVVVDVAVLEGDAVEPGQVVARLIDDDAILARDRAVAGLDEALSSVSAAAAELVAASARMDDRVERDLAIERASAELESVAAARAELEAEIRVAEAKAGATDDEFTRKSTLVESEAVSRGEVERLRLRLIAERAALDAARAGVPVLDARQKVAEAEQRAAIRHAELLIDERRAVALAEAGVARADAAAQSARVALGEAELRLDRTRVRSSVAGVVMHRMVSPGSRLQVTSGDHSAHVLHLYDPERLQVRVDVPLADAAQVGLGQRAEIVVDALPDRVFSGAVTRLVHVADVAKNTVEFKVAVDDPEPVLRPEMLARVRFLAAKRVGDGAEAPRQRVFVTERALKNDGAATQVLVAVNVISGRGRVEVRDVTTGTMRIEDHVEILAGLRPGDRAIVDSPAGLAHDDRIVLEDATHGGTR